MGRSRTPSSPQRLARAGFSMLELVVALVIILILSTVGLLGYANLKESDEPRSAAKILVSTLAGARQAAITANSRYQVYLDFPAREIWIDELDAAGVVLRRQVSNPGQLPRFMAFESVEIDGANQTGDSAAIGFWPDGHSQTATIVLARSVGDTSDEAFVAAIRVFGPTGTARITLGERP
jgi:prepilin-type N-terminal cleavage/methylation domain-containing protein